MLSSFAATRSLRSCVRSPLFTASRALPRVAKTPTPPTAPSFRQQLFKENPTFKSFSDDAQIKRPPIIRQVAFAVLGSGAIYFYGALRTNEDTFSWAKKLRAVVMPWGGGPGSEQMNRARYLALGKKLQSIADSLRSATANLPLVISQLVLFSYAKVANAVLSGTEGNRIAWTICAVNGVVWGMWQIRRLRPMMQRAFLHHPLSGLSYTLLTSMFSHKAFLHLLFNSLALSGFAYTATVYLTNEQHKSGTRLKESTAKWHFLAFYVSAGLFSGLVSHVVATRIRFPRLLAQLKSSPSSTLATTNTSRPLLSSSPSNTPTIKSSANKFSEGTTPPILPSLGASGAIYAAVVLSTLAFPDAHVSLIFPPWYPLPITWAVGGMVCLDVLGVLRGWRMFDHCAHLGGAAFGALYYVYGPRVWDFWRMQSLDMRNGLTRSFKKSSTEGSLSK